MKEQSAMRTLTGRRLSRWVIFAVVLGAFFIGGGIYHAATWRDRLDGALIEASLRGDSSAILTLLRQGANPNAFNQGCRYPWLGPVLGECNPDLISCPALVLAAKSGKIAAVRVLLDHGADPEVSCRQWGNPCGLYAFDEANDEIKRMLTDIIVKSLRSK